MFFICYKIVAIEQITESKTSVEPWINITLSIRLNETEGLKRVQRNNKEEMLRYTFMYCENPLIL